MYLCKMVEWYGTVGTGTCYGTFCTIVKVVDRYLLFTCNSEFLCTYLPLTYVAIIVMYGSNAYRIKKELLLWCESIDGLSLLHAV